MSEISICMISYNTRQLLADCLRSIEASGTRRSVEIIITDNGSTDGTQEMLQIEFPQVLLIQNDSNLGYTVPMNQALRQAGGRYLVQLNPDTLVQSGLFDTLVDYLEANPQVGILSPKVLNRDGTLQSQCRRSAARPWDALSYILHLDRLFPKSRRFGGYLMTYMDENTTHEAEAVSGSCMLIRREVVEGIGYLDEAIFAYQEDAEFCFRARKEGWKIVYLPTASIIHFGGQGGSKNQPYRGVIEWHRSYYYYYRKHLAQDYFFLFNWMFYALMGAKLGVSLVATFFRKEKHVGTPKPQ
jgi:GT2 family glycosyltransferase